MAYWASISLATEQYGFIVSALIYGWMYTKNFISWRK